MAEVLPVSPSGPSDKKAPWRRSRRQKGSLLHLLDDDPAHFTVADWAERNLGLFDELSRRRLVDDTVPLAAHRFLTGALVNEQNPAAEDPLNAGHVRAQNANIVHYGLSVSVAPSVLAVALEAGFIHDLNKAIGEPLRTDRFAVRKPGGEILESIETMAQCVGLNHLGDRTRRVLVEATELEEGALDPKVAETIDQLIVHHGLGSSRFITRLIDGHNEWWGEEFVDPKTGLRRLVHPSQPELTAASLIHDLADSTQQMQGGVAWLLKYPEGFWRGENLSYWQMLSDESTRSANRTIAMSLRRQMIVERSTCRSIIAMARADLRLRRVEAERLEAAMRSATRRTRQWIDDSVERLDKARAPTVYHDVAKELGLRPAEAVDRLKSEGPGSEVLDPIIWRSARALDLRRARDLARLIEQHTEQ